MKFRIAIIFLIMNFLGIAQDIQSKGDAFYFQYAYKEAIVQYKKESLKAPLNNTQLLNLADSYLKQKLVKQALEVYMEVHQKDLEMPAYHVNKMLQSMAGASGLKAVQTFLEKDSIKISKELKENANFNFELLQLDRDKAKEIVIFNSAGNSPQSDFSPSFYGEKLLFASGRPKPSKKRFRNVKGSFLNLYVARVSGDGKLMNPNLFTGIPKSNFHNATPFYSETLESILFIRSNSFGNELAFDKNGKNALALGIVDVDGEFRMLLSDLSTSFYYPYYDAKSSKLYFTANFEDSYGGTDIYYVHTNNGQIMSAPINLGPRINTPGNDMAAYIYNNSLYFSSDVFYGQGGMDVYRSNFQPDGTFSIPVNLGEGINSISDDFGFIIRDDGNELLGYFASNRQGGAGDDDIYGFHTGEKPGLRTIVVKGEIRTTNSRNKINGALVSVLDTNKNIIKELYASEEGEYIFEIPWREEITVAISKNSYSNFTKTIKEELLRENEEYIVLDAEMILLDDLIEEKENQAILKLKKFYFQRYKATITAEIALELDKIVTAVSAFPQLKLEIETHTDSRGGSTTNLRLSQRRSQAILNYLLKKGVPQDNIVDAIGYGESKIINNCKNGVYCLDFLHKKNERSNVVIKNYDQLK